MLRLDAASFQLTSSRHYISAKSMTYRFNPYITNQFPKPPCTSMQVDERTERSPESMCVRSQSVAICPIAGQKIDLHERQQYFCHPKLSKPSTISKMGCFFTFPYIHMMVPKYEIGGWVNKQVKGPPPSLLRCPTSDECDRRFGAVWYLSIMAFWVAFANFFFVTTSPDMYTKKMQRKEVSRYLMGRTFTQGEVDGWWRLSEGNFLLLVSCWDVLCYLAILVI